MKDKSKPRQKILIFRNILGFVLCAVVGVVIYLFLPPPSDPLMEYANQQLEAEAERFRVAHSIWGTQNLTDYRVTIRFYHPGGSCNTVIEVIDSIGNIADLSGDACDGQRYHPIEVWSVDGIFNHFELLFTEPLCGPNGCICDGYVVPIVEYHDTLGYPTLFRFDLTGNQRPANHPCPELGIGAVGYSWDRIEVIELEPISD